MADEQLSLQIEQLAESVRTSMSREDAEEPLQSLLEIIEKEQEGYLHEVCGQIFRSLLPAFVMTDADFKTPASMPNPTKPMYMVKDTCVDWVMGLSRKIPRLTDPISVDRVAYRRRMHMASMDDNDEEAEERGDEPENDAGESEDDSENTPPNGATVAAKPTKNEPQVILDPFVALMQRMAVRCPDKAEWRRGVCDSLSKMKIKGVAERYVSTFLLNLMVSDKAAWRSFACEASAGIQPSVTVHAHVLARCNDSSAIVRSSALKSLTLIVDQLRHDDSLRQDYLDSSISALTQRAVDEKPFVRRAAVSVFDSFVNFFGLGKIPLALVEKFSLDESLIVRKASVGSALSLLADEHMCTLPEVTNLYAQTVLPMITDVETSVVEKVVESFDVLVLSPLVNKVAKRCEEDISSCPKSLLVLLNAIGQTRDSTEFARRVLRILCRKFDQKTNKQISLSIDRLVSGLLTGISSPRPASPGLSIAAMRVVSTTLLALQEELGSVANVSSSKLSLWLPILISMKSDMTLGLVHALRCLARNITKDSTELLASLEAVVESPCEELSLVHDLVRCLAAGEYPKRKFQNILESVEKILESAIYDSNFNETSLAWNLCLIGELAAIGYMPSAKGLTSVEAIATNRVYHNGGSDHFSLPASIRGVGMVAFGKICLQKESIAKRAVSKFAAHLAREEHPIVRNNVLIVLGDLCVVYTGLVDQYLPWVTTCLADPSDLIRYQAAVVVSSLLAEDYIKFKGQIVYRLLFLLSDPNVKIQSFVESVFSRILFLRHSGSLKTLFAETVCALNGYLRHPAYQGAIGNREFLLTANPSRRKEVYEFMLSNVVTAEQKFNVMMQLCHSLLAAFVDEDATNGAVQIPEREEGPAGQVLIDTLGLICHRALKLSSSNDGSAAADPTEEDKEAKEKKQFEAALQKKTVVENIVPLLIQLNSVSEQKRSPITRYVRECLKELIKDYKDEVTRIIHADTQLAQELLFDLGVAPEAVPAIGIVEETAAPALVEEATRTASPPPPVKGSGSENSDEEPVARKRAKKKAPATVVKQEEEEDVAPPPTRSSRLARKRKD